MAESNKQKRYALYLKAVRIFEMDDLANAAHQFHIFPALDKISFGLRENRKFAISNLRIDADGGHRVDLLDYHELAFDTTQDEFFVVPNDGLPSTWSCGGVSKDRCNITILPARRPVARTPHTGNESTQAEYNVYTPLEKRLYPYDGLIAKLSIIPTVEIKKLVQVLLSKPNTWSKDEDPSVPTELSVIYEHCSGRALTRFAPLVQRGLKHLKLEREEVHATYVSLEAVLEHTCWDKLRGLRTLDLSVSDPKIHSKGRSYGTTAPVLEIAPVTCPPLHLDEFAIRFHIEGNTDVRGKRTDRLDLSCFPRLSNLALALLSIGGPACKYTLAITGPVNLKTAAHHVTSWLTALLRLEIAALLEVKPENAGWRRIKKEKDV